MNTFYQYWVSRYCSRDPFSPFSCCRQVSTAETLINQASAPNSKKGYPFLDILFLNYESARRDSNPRPQPWQGCTPPTEPLAHYLSTYLQNHTLKIYSSVTTCGVCRSLIPFGQALDLLVTVSYTRYRASTSALSTSSSSRGFTSFEWDISS